MSARQILVLLAVSAVGLAAGFAGGLYFMSGPVPVFHIRVVDHPPGDGIFVSNWVERAPTCVWSQGSSEFEFNVAFSPALRNVELELLAEGMVSSKRPVETINVVVNGSQVATWTITKQDARLRVPISDAVLRARSPLRIALIEAAPMSPSALGIGSSTVPRSICVSDVTFFGTS